LNHTLLLLLAAVFGGAINSVAGGGSFLTFPALLFAGVPAIPANATNNTAMWLGVVASARGYREEVRAYRPVIVPAITVSLFGSLIGAVLLLHTPAKIFERMIPWLLLFATVVLRSVRCLHASTKRATYIPRGSSLRNLPFPFTAAILARAWGF
jgi:uncharacterized membrane protein YfcA